VIVANTLNLKFFSPKVLSLSLLVVISVPEIDITEEIYVDDEVSIHDPPSNTYNLY
jgi:hypothetical protein